MCNSMYHVYLHMLQKLCIPVVLKFHRVTICGEELPKKEDFLLRKQIKWTCGGHMLLI